jgi:hypothetical protein
VARLSKQKLEAKRDGERQIVQVLDINDMQPALSAPVVIGIDRPHGSKTVAKPQGNRLELSPDACQRIKNFDTVENRRLRKRQPQNDMFVIS